MHVCVVVALLMRAGLLPAAAAPTDAVLDDASNGRDWAAYGRTYGEQHYSPLSEIDTNTVQKLSLAWFYDLGPGNSVSQPLAVDGVVFTATGYSVVRAFEATTGRLLWSYDPQVTQAAGAKLRNGWGIRGLASWNGKLYVGTHDGRLIALDAKNGKPVWSVMTLAADSVANITGAPRVFAGRVIIGFNGGDYASIRGYVSTYDAETGKLLWRFYTVPSDPAKGFEDATQAKSAKTWRGNWWQFGGGGAVWNAITYDAETDTVFIGTGNGSPWNKKVRSPGESDDLFLSSIVALDGRTGAYRWHYQVNPGETWDYDAAMDMPLATLTIGGRARKVVLQAPKNGFFYVIDRLTGELISADPYVKVTWATRVDLRTGRPVEVHGDRYENGNTFTLWPGAAGGHNWQAMSFSPKTGLVYIPTLEMPSTYQDRGIDLAHWRRPPGSSGDNAVNLGFATGLTETSEAFLQAWDPVHQKQVWKAPSYGVWNGGTMATGGGLVFEGQADGTFRALDAATGKILWHFDAQDAVLAAPITYEAAGRQYVTVLSGFGTSFALLDVGPNRLPWTFANQARRVLTFALGGTVSLPTVQKSVPSTVARRPELAPDPAAVSAGLVLYHQECVACHGIGAVGIGTAPDLRTSAMPGSAASFKEVVHGGALITNGMPRFDQLTPAQVEDLRSYLVSRARDLSAGR